MVKASKSYCSKHLKQKLRQEERKLNKRKMIALEKVSIFRKQKLSKTKIKVAKIREKIANQRTDILNKITTELVSSYDVICIEKPITVMSGRQNMIVLNWLGLYFS